MNNEAFRGEPHVEVARLLRELADKLENERMRSPIGMMDPSGNTVGMFTLSPRDIEIK